MTSADLVFGEKEIHAEPRSRGEEYLRERPARRTNLLARFARRSSLAAFGSALDAKKELRVSAAPRESFLFPSRTKEAGYTLMELLVVLAILGLLAAIATPMVLKYLDSAKLGTAKTEIANLSAGLDLFKYDVGRYPTTQE